MEIEWIDVLDDMFTSDHKDFSTGLEHRNVFLNETAARDPQADHINSLASKEPFQETDKEKEFHDELWALDQANATMDPTRLSSNGLS
jgi:hypothetical protein